MNGNEYQRFSDRYFSLSPLYAVPGWYFRVRGNCCKGPYLSLKTVVLAARAYGEACQRGGETGGR